MRRVGVAQFLMLQITAEEITTSADSLPLICLKPLLKLAWMAIQ